MSKYRHNFTLLEILVAVAVLVIYALYKYVPGTHVHSRHAFKAALLSGVAFAAVQYLYLETQMMVAKQSAVYGVLAAIPLFMVWLNLGWTIVLYGAELSYAFQNVDRHRTTIEMLDEMIEKGFISSEDKNMFTVTTNIDETFNYINK